MNVQYLADFSDSTVDEENFLFSTTDEGNE